MTFPHSEDARHLVNEAARIAIESHNQPEHILDPEARKMREKEHTGIELTGPELAFLRKLISDEVHSTENKISVLSNSLREGNASNTNNAEQELHTLNQKIGFLRHNLVEKLFKKQEETIH